MDFNFDFSSLVAGFIFGVIGLWVFREARRKENSNVLYIGIALMVYPYFFDGPVKNWGIGFALCAAAYYLW